MHFAYVVASQDCGRHYSPAFVSSLSKSRQPYVSHCVDDKDAKRTTPCKIGIRAMAVVLHEAFKHTCMDA